MPSLEPGGVWLDSVRVGAFTPGASRVASLTGSFYSVDKDNGSLLIERAMRATSTQTTRLHYQTADLHARLLSPNLDGLVMANSLHFQRNQAGGRKDGCAVIASRWAVALLWNIILTGAILPCPS